MKKRARLTVFAMTVITLASCGGTPGSDYVLSLPETDQRQALMACQAEQGVHVPQAINVLRLNDGRVVASAVNGPELSLAQARAINQCARAKLSDGQIGTPVSYQPTPTPAARPLQHVQSPPVYETRPLHAPVGCVQGGGALQGGSAICPGY